EGREERVRPVAEECAAAWERLHAPLAVGRRTVARPVVLLDHARRAASQVKRQDQTAGIRSLVRWPPLVVEQADAIAGQWPRVVLEPEPGSRAEPETRGLATERPQDLAARAPHLVYGTCVTGGDEDAVIADRLDRVQVVGVEVRAERRRGVGVLQRDATERVP